MKPSHIHVAFKDQAAAAQWFKSVLKIEPVVENPTMAIFRFGDLDFVIDSDWGDGDTSMTFAIASKDCQADFDRAIKNGARPRKSPRDKGDVIGGDVFGPGKLVVEFEQVKTTLIC